MFILRDGKDLCLAVMFCHIGKAAKPKEVQAIAAAREDRITDRLECQSNQKCRDPLVFP